MRRRQTDAATIAAFLRTRVYRPESLVWLEGYLVRVVPADVVMASRAMTLWNLDEDRLARAVAHFAPHVAMIDTRLSR
ncbi:hypothetical protein [Streptomyces sp. NPDC001312]|uniref:hypothetical protein n=1 Tax=Streptomyces sp. NPDC001312 TaxID=3364561 RepID=UPI0036779F8A